MTNTRSVFTIAAAACVASVLTTGAAADHHFMQIHQVIGGVNGDTSAQAVQLRMRSSFQNQMQNGKLWVRDAAGANPVLLIDFLTSVPNHGAGVTVLITTANFVDQCDPTCVPDFTMNAIPASYLDAGTMTFENNAGTQIWWRLSWGGDNYTGPTNGTFANDADGDFGTYPFPLPSDSLQALLFQGPANAMSTNNADDYDVTPGAAVFTNNAGNSFTVVGSSSAGVCPDTGTILNGSPIGGGFGDVCDSDDVRWGITSNTFAAVFSPAPIQIEFTGNVAPLGGTNLTFTVEGFPELGKGTAFVQLQMFNYTTGSYVGMPFSSQPDGSDIVYSSTRAAADFVDSNGNVKAQLTFAKTSPGPVRARIDQVFWLVD